MTLNDIEDFSEFLQSDRNPVLDRFDRHILHFGNFTVGQTDFTAQEKGMTHTGRKIIEGLRYQFAQVQSLDKPGKRLPFQTGAGFERSGIVPSAKEIYRAVSRNGENQSAEVPVFIQRIASLPDAQESILGKVLGDIGIVHETVAEMYEIVPFHTIERLESGFVAVADGGNKFAADGIV